MSPLTNKGHQRAVQVGKRRTRGEREAVPEGRVHEPQKTRLSLRLTSLSLLLSFSFSFSFSLRNVKKKRKNRRIVDLYIAKEIPNPNR